MSYDIYVKDGHHHVNMGPPISRGVRIKIDEGFLDRVGNKLERLGEAFGNIGLLIGGVLALKAYTIRIKGGHHYVSIKQPYVPDEDFEVGMHEFAERYDGTMRALAKRSAGGDADAEGAGRDGQT